MAFQVTLARSVRFYFRTLKWKVDIFCSQLTKRLISIWFHRVELLHPVWRWKSDNQDCSGVCANKWLNRHNLCDLHHPSVSNWGLDDDGWMMKTNTLKVCWTTYRTPTEKQFASGWERAKKRIKLQFLVFRNGRCLAWKALGVKFQRFHWITQRANSAFWNWQKAVGAYRLRNSFTVDCLINFFTHFGDVKVRLMRFGVLCEEFCNHTARRYRITHFTINNCAILVI